MVRIKGRKAAQMGGQEVSARGGDSDDDEEGQVQRLVSGGGYQ